MNILTVNAELFCRIDCETGEGPFWHERRLYWVDIFQRRLQSCDENGSDLRFLTLPSDLGAAAPWPGGFIVGTAEGLALLTPEGAYSLLPGSPRLPSDTRFNDGKLDPSGRFWCGTTTYEFTPGNGALYRVNRNGEIKCMLENLTLSNGLDWDEKCLYFIDTATQRVDAFDYDNASGEIANRRVAFEVPKEFGVADGMACDRFGRVWVACWGGSQVVGFDPASGRVVARILVPTRQSSSCSVGPDRRSLYITFARRDLSPEVLANEPLAGSIFRADLPET